VDTYAERLRVEGAVLAATGLAGSALLLRAAPQARRWPLNTLAQLAAVAAWLGLRGRAQADGWLDDAGPVGPGEQPDITPLWHVPAPVVAGALLFKGLERTGLPASSKAGWDASLRWTAGSAVAGLFQALVLAPHVRAREAREGRTYVRRPGSRLGATQLGFRA
jgi:hypothetical protein